MEPQVYEYIYIEYFEVLPFYFQSSENCRKNRFIKE